MQIGGEEFEVVTDFYLLRFKNSQGCELGER